ncbi:HRDC domain-containing protein [Agromyces seonyuensis]|uniref:Ribonuclease D n=1 Tax=Agromyces seonyuensis TaxID=2662446 RepID=A0A6I4NSZ3_9MICO|nr:ribonuclease D [Agromyces seonyuensis]
MGEYRVIDGAGEFEQAVAAIAAGEGPVAVDAERASGFRYSQRAYLIQVFRRGAGVFLFDPPAIGGFASLQAAIGEEEWVLHAASQDLACLREVGLDPARIFDTELAARLLGLPRVGLGPVVEELLGVHLKKEHSAADWSTRPLPQAWLEYAALDVELLVDVRDAMAKRLVAARKTGIAGAEFEAVLRKEPKPAAADPWRRLSGLSSIRSPRQLAIARELWLERDRLAVELDLAPGRLVPDSSLLAAAKAQPRARRELADLRAFTGRASRSELDRWWAAVQRGIAETQLPPMRVPSEGPPPHRGWAHRHPDADARLRTARPAVQAAADVLGMPTENLLTPDHLRRVAWQPPQPADAEHIGAALAALGARDWQIAATAQIIAASFVEAEQALMDAESDPS